MSASEDFFPHRPGDRHRRARCHGSDGRQKRPPDQVNAHVWRRLCATACDVPHCGRKVPSWQHPVVSKYGDDISGPDRLSRLSELAEVAGPTDQGELVEQAGEPGAAPVAAPVERPEWTVEGKLARRAEADGSQETWTYDGEGNCLSRTSALGATVTFEYTDFDLLRARTEPDGARYEFTHECDPYGLSPCNKCRTRARRSTQQPAARRAMGGGRRPHTTPPLEQLRVRPQPWCPRPLLAIRDTTGYSGDRRTYE
ncbi:RHS repeat domain-containing protein [Streptomyces sp. Tu 2975]|uniref:RHS repeat domain-containing protein n=1 Tax=Streptomyces sp. Tu 2975 TaxID=2676871 RepID=UPI001ABDC33A|nr:RHS repeat domain-containing protein [Streptomyces sp. Tu 2975]